MSNPAELHFSFPSQLLILLHEEPHYQILIACHQTMVMRGFSKISGKVQRKKNPKFLGTTKHAQEQSHANFLDCHGDRNSKNCELLFNYNKTNGKENKCIVSHTFLCAAISSFNATFSAGISTSVVANTHLVQLEVACMTFPGRLSVHTSVCTTKCQEPT